MKTKKIITILMTMILAIVPALTQKKQANRDTVVYHVAMDCHNCQQKIEKNIAFEKGVRAMKVSLEKQTVEISYDTRRNSVEKLQEAIKKLGYEAKIIQNEKK